LLLVIFQVGGLSNFLLGLALNHDPPDLFLPKSWGYRRAPPL
jgi:hypothetical protein